MKKILRFTGFFLLMSLTVSACSLLTPPTSSEQTENDPTQETGAATATLIPTTLPFPTVTATAEPLQLEVVQSQTWNDKYGNVRVNVLFRNPYDFPVSPSFRGHVSLLNKADDLLRAHDLYFLDGISGGGGFLLPGEIIGANACFTCEELPVTEEWDSVRFDTVMKDATGSMDYYSDVEPTVGSVEFDGDSPVFFVNGSVKNNTDKTLSRVSVRIIVYDQDGKLVGAAESSAWDVGAGTTASFSGNGIGLKPGGPMEYDVSALGVIY